MAKKVTLEDLKGKIHTNKHKIAVFNKMIPALGFLFILISFLTFYMSSVLQVSSLYEIIFGLLLVAIILTMLLFKELINKMKKENRKFDNKIYYRLYKVKAG
ncbi:MAG: hypothetical protein JXR05_08605 [Flavobacteriaceae bacterium]